MAKLTLPGTTIVETVMAMLLVMVSLGIGLMIYLNVLTSERLVARVKAQALLSRISEETIAQQLFISEALEADGMVVEKKVAPYAAEFPDAYLLTLTAFAAKNKQPLCELKEIIYPQAQNGYPLLPSPR
ncbi:MAG: hypothetical protein IPN76_03290 [Saprospiraceae bacterium]|nr:hypothetical protein [Saprospiraceae bacterium]